MITPENKQPGGPETDFVQIVFRTSSRARVHQAEVGEQALGSIKEGMNGPTASQMSACERQRFSLCRYRRSAALIIVERSVEKALAISASVRSVGLLVPRSSWPI